MKTKVYISGRISGLQSFQYQANFLSATTEILRMKICSLLDIVNPCEIKPLFGIRKWFFHMAADIWALLFCSHVAFQKSWIDSKGARIEMIVAILFNKKIIML